MTRTVFQQAENGCFSALKSAPAVEAVVYEGVQVRSLRTVGKGPAQDPFQRHLTTLELTSGGIRTTGIVSLVPSEGRYVTFNVPGRLYPAWAAQFKNGDIYAICHYGARDSSNAAKPEYLYKSGLREVSKRIGALRGQGLSTFARPAAFMNSDGSIIADFGQHRTHPGGLMHKSSASDAWSRPAILHARGAEIPVQSVTSPLQRVVTATCYEGGVWATDEPTAWKAFPPSVIQGKIPFSLEGDRLIVASTATSDPAHLTNSGYTFHIATNDSCFPIRIRRGLGAMIGGCRPVFTSQGGLPNGGFALPMWDPERLFTTDLFHVSPVGEIDFRYEPPPGQGVVRIGTSLRSLPDGSVISTFSLDFYRSILALCRPDDRQFQEIPSFSKTTMVNATLLGDAWVVVQGETGWMSIARTADVLSGGPLAFETSHCDHMQCDTTGALVGISVDDGRPRLFRIPLKVGEAVQFYDVPDSERLLTFSCGTLYDDFSLSIVAQSGDEVRIRTWS